MQIEIVVPKGTNVLSVLFANADPEIGEIKDHKDFKIKYEGLTSQQGLGGQFFNEIITVSFSIVGNISLSILSNYLYDIGKDKVKKYWINNKEVKVDKKELQDALDELKIL